MSTLLPGNLSISKGCRASICLRRHNGIREPPMNATIDSYKRHINYLRISVTDRCNLRCIYCMPKNGIPMIGHDDILRYEEIAEVARQSAEMGISKIRITGGEPLVRKGIVHLISDLNAIPGIEDISITTNGQLLADCVEDLRCAGLKRLNISLDSLNAEKYTRITRGGSLSSVLAGIRIAWEAGFSPIKLNVVAMRGINDDEIQDFAKLTLERPAHIRFIEFMPVAHNTSWKQDRYLPNSEVKEKIRNALGDLLPDASAKRAGPAEMFHLKGAQGKLGFISPLSNHFCGSCNRLRLTADGKLRNCLFSDEEIDLKPFLRKAGGEAQLRETIVRSVQSKPMRHTILEPTFKKCLRGMSAIGG